MFPAQAQAQEQEKSTCRKGVDKAAILGSIVLGVYGALSLYNYYQGDDVSVPQMDPNAVSENNPEFMEQLSNCIGDTDDLAYKLVTASNTTKLYLMSCSASAAEFVARNASLAVPTQVSRAVSPMYDTMVAVGGGVAGYLAAKAGGKAIDCVEKSCKSDESDLQHDLMAAEDDYEPFGQGNGAAFNFSRR